MKRPWIGYISFGVGIIGIVFGILSGSYANAYAKQVDRHEMLLEKLTDEVHEIRLLLEGEIHAAHSTK
jgi:hypothetical protein